MNPHSPPILYIDTYFYFIIKICKYILYNRVKVKTLIHVETFLFTCKQFKLPSLMNPKFKFKL